MATTEGEAGDGFLFTQGYTVIRVGWEFDARREGAVRIDTPAAVGVTGFARATFIPTSKNAEVTVGDLAGYSPTSPGAPENTLKVRDATGSWTAIPRGRWQLQAGNVITLDGGFEPGRTYELAYTAANPPVAGLGYAAVRDAASWVRYAADATVSARYAYAYGSSQTGRWLRDFLYEGFNTDERNRAVFDAVIPHIAGGSGIDLNRRWSTPTSLSMETAMHFPFSDRKQRDPVTGVEEGLLENARASEHQPKIFLTSSSTEYWERSLALVHTTPDGSKDVALPDNTRLYYFAGAAHNVGRFPPAVGNGQLPDNPLDYPWSLRALLVAMDDWVRKGVTPPPSRYPRLQNATLVHSRDVAFPDIPGVASPRKVAPGTRGPNRLLLKDGAGAPLPLLVPQTDKDGNELSGIRFPQVTVPLATFTGWNFRKAEIGGAGQLFPLQGGYVPFANTRAEREQARDPRLSIEERYQSREHYLTLVRDAGATLVKDGYLLADDLPKVVERAGEHWDLLARRPAGSVTRAGR
jgi:alpha/beta hydrolase family protein